MKSKSIIIMNILLFLVLGNRMFAQTPTLGTTANFVLFTSSGAITNTGISQITGNVGSNIGAGTGFGNVNGVMHGGDGATAQAAADLTSLYNELNAAIPTFFVGSLLGNGDTLVPGVYHITGVTSLSDTLILDGLGNPNAIFIFQIEAAFSTNANSKIKLINGALACNIFWKVEGLVDMATGTYIQGTIVAHNAAINMNTSDTLVGRALSTTGAISINGVKANTPIGCGSLTLTGPTMPTLGTAACYTLFTSNGAMTNSGVSMVTGNVGTNVGLTTGFDPLFVNGSIHTIPDGSTAMAAADLLNAANLMNIMPYDIELLYPAQFGHDLVLTPHSYLMNAATSFTGNIYLNAQGNPNAIFLIKIYGAFASGVASHVILINGTQADNVYWLVTGAVSIDGNSIFNGNLISRNGAISTLSTGVQINGRLLTTDGAFNTSAINAISMSPCFALPLDWLYFNGESKQRMVQLSWGTMNEVNNNYFLIEKSKDGQSFEMLTKVNTEQGDLTSKNEYEFVDLHPYQSTFYRISQIDIDGHQGFYKTIEVITHSQELVVYHHSIGEYIDVQITNPPIGKGSIELFSIQGEFVSSTAIQLHDEFNQFKINNPLIKGLYLMKITVNGESIYTDKVLVD